MLLSALHNVGPEALEEAEHLVCLLIRDSEVAQCACSMAHECLPIGGIDSHPVMGQFHAATGVKAGPPAASTMKSTISCRARR